MLITDNDSELIITIPKSEIASETTRKLVAQTHSSDCFMLGNELFTASNVKVVIVGTGETETKYRNKKREMLRIQRDLKQAMKADDWENIGTMSIRLATLVDELEALTFVG